PSASWSDKDVAVLVDLLLQKNAEAGEGMNYKIAFWNSVSAALSPPERGAVKTAKGCKEKWKMVHSLV
ncbi:hypothetical protein PAXRUDRAFT_159570, partial [Paxillus rubicundulus Ve08.2h10]